MHLKYISKYIITDPFGTDEHRAVVACKKVRCCALRGKNRSYMSLYRKQTAPQIVWSAHERRYACTHSTQLLYEVGITEPLLYIRMHEATHSIPTRVWRKYLCSELSRSLRRNAGAGLLHGCAIAAGWMSTTGSMGWADEGEVEEEKTIRFAANGL